MRRVLLCGAVGAVGVALLIGCGKKVDPAAEGAKAEAAERFRRIGRAVLDASAQGTASYPAGVVGSKGELGLSWRVALLPHLGEQALESLHNRG